MSEFLKGADMPGFPGNQGLAGDFPGICGANIFENTGALGVLKNTFQLEADSGMSFCRETSCNASELWKNRPRNPVTLPIEKATSLL